MTPVPAAPEPAPPESHGPGRRRLTRLALSATIHCLIGCVAGEIAGMAIGAALGWSDAATILIAIGLAFLFGYSLTALPLVRAGLRPRIVASTALASDTISIAIMEAIDNLFIVLVPGAMAAGLGDALFWAALLGGLVLAFPFALLANRALIARGKGHALVHEQHHQGGRSGRA